MLERHHEDCHVENWLAISEVMKAAVLAKGVFDGHARFVKCLRHPRVTCWFIG